jgi:hypothetical protein
MQPYNQPPPNYYPPYGAPPPPRRRNVLPWILVGALATLGFIGVGFITLSGLFDDFPPFPDSPPKTALSFAEKAAIEEKFASPGAYIVSDIALYRTSTAQVNSMRRNIDSNLTGKGWQKSESAGQTRYAKGGNEYAVIAVSTGNASQFPYLPSYLTSNLGRSDSLLLVVTLQNID